MIAVAGLVSLAGCAGDPPPVVDPGPLPGETFADTDDPRVKSCLTVVSRNTGIAAVSATGIAETPEGTIITVVGEGNRWHCRVHTNGRVMAMVPL
jgi:hypothetical protein